MPVPESNRGKRLCRPLHNHSATWPWGYRLYTGRGRQYKKGPVSRAFWSIWSGKPDSNRRPQPWQGCALPTELFPQKLCILARQNILSSPTQTERVLAVFLALGRMFMCAAGACWLRRQAVYYSALAAVVQGCGWRPQLYTLHDSDGKAVQSLFVLV